MKKAADASAACTDSTERIVHTHTHTQWHRLLGLIVMVFYFSTFSLLGQNPECGTETISYDEKMDFFESIGFDVVSQTGSILSVAGSGVVERNFPLHVYVISDSQNTPPFSQALGRFGASLAEANSLFFDLQWNFYICGVSYVQDNTENQILYQPNSINNYINISNIYGRDNEISVFLVNSLSGNGSTVGYSNIPAYEVNAGGIFLNKIGASTTEYIAHEFGHYFGLDHTFSRTYAETEVQGNLAYYLLLPDYSYDYVDEFDPPLYSSYVPECALDPLASCDGTVTDDFISDTNIDPYSLQNCNEGIDCIVDFHGNTYEYTPPYNNLMSYYGGASTFSTIQEIVMLQTLLIHPHRAFLLDEIEPVCEDVEFVNPFIAKKGRVERVRSNDAGDGFKFDPMPDIDVEIFNFRDNVGCVHSTDEEGAFDTDIDFCGGTNLLPPDEDGLHVDIDVEFGHDEMQELDYMNGVSTLDLIRIQKHLLGVELLDSPYKIIAADINNNGTISTFDLIRLQKYILGVETPNQVVDAPAWRFLPRYSLDEEWNFETAFFTNPFTAFWNYTDGDRHYLSPVGGNKSYLDKLDFNLLNPASSLEDNWSFIGIKTGDVNEDANVQEDEFTDPNDVFSLMVSPHDGIKQGQKFTILCKIEGGFNMEGYQIPFEFSPDKFKVSGFSQGDLPYFSLDNFGIKSTDLGYIRALWFNQGTTSGIAVNSGFTLFKIDAVATSNITDISSAIRFNSTSIPMEIINDQKKIEKAGVTLEVILEGTKHNLKSVFPNPISSSSIGVEFDLSAEKPVSITLTDFYGNTLSHSSIFTEGTHTYLFDDVSSLSNGMIIYSVVLDDEVNTGYLIKL